MDRHGCGDRQVLILARLENSSRSAQSGQSVEGELQLASLVEIHISLT